MLLTTIAFIIIFSVLVLIHEWGHFAAARKAKIKVEEFGFGLPPQAKALFKDKRGTVYSLNWIPFGGFVRLYGEDSSDPKVLKSKESFASKTLWQRTTVILAGVFMNFLLAWFLITIGFIFGTKPFLATNADFERAIESGIVQAEQSFLIQDILETSPLMEVGVKENERIISLNGNKVSNETRLSELIKPSQDVSLTVRDEEGIDRIVKVKSNEQGKIQAVLSLENQVTEVKNISYPFYIAPFQAVYEVGRLSVLTTQMLGSVVSNLVGKFAVPEGVAGPVGIFKMTERHAEQGLMALIQFTALLSISLAVINVMPFPALDGGRFLFIIFELITRRKPNAKWEAIIHSVGFILLMVLILVITWNDILTLIKG